MMIALMVGLIGGIGLAFFVEYLDNTVKTSDDIEKEISLPSLGLVPQLAKKEEKNVCPIITFEDKKSPLSEAYRSIGTYIQFSSAGRPPKSILVTSARQGEGKTTTVVNIAVTLTHTYGKGIVIDCDMRKPQLHKIFGVDNSRGLSAFLAGHMELDDGLVQKTKVESLDVITSGIIPPNPSELLSSYRFKDLITALFPLYSFILIDSPPVLGLSDSLVLSTMTDGVVMVTRAGSTPKDVAVQAKKLLTGVNAKILGVVLNGMTEADLKYGSYSYYYSHYYGDGYEDNKGKRKRRKTDSA
jgi:succinoglycan biosynthesis transport protein ExoP